MTDYGTKKYTSTGFSLLEILIVLAILAIVLSVITPNITFNTAEENLRSESHALRFALQDVADQSWLTDHTLIVSQTDERFSVWQQNGDNWEEVHSLYELPPKLTFHLKTDLQEIKQAIDILNFDHNGVLVFLASGEYTPFTLTLMAENRSAKLEGDGINDISLQ